MSQKMTMRKGEVSLDGYGRRKGFYGKCGARLVNGVLILRSYNTENYAAAYNGRLFALSGFWSATSGTHLDAFARYAGVEYHGKRGNGKRDPFAWDNMNTLKVANLGDAFVAAEVIAAYNAMYGNAENGAKVA